MTDSLRLRLAYALAGTVAWLAYRVFGLRRAVKWDAPWDGFIRLIAIEGVK